MPINQWFHRLFPLMFIAVVSAISCSAQDRALNTVEVELQRLIQDPALKHGQLAFVAVNLDNGTVIAEHNNYRSMIPASIQKVITTATSLDRFGPAHSFKTSIGFTGSIAEGTLARGPHHYLGRVTQRLDRASFGGDEGWERHQGGHQRGWHHRREREGHCGCQRVCKAHHTLTQCHGKTWATTLALHPARSCGKTT